MSSFARERGFVFVLCTAAALRVLTYGLAFPFFNNVDEQTQFDLVSEYSAGRVPRAVQPIGPEAAHTIAVYGSPEYFSRPEEHPGGRYPPPPWSQGTEQSAAEVARNEAGWRAFPNYQALSPPLYFALAGGWLNAGRALGLDAGSQLYWLRMLDVPCAALLVWLAYATSRRAFPERRFARLGTPALVAILPQDTFYSIQSDVLSPLCFGAAFLALLRWSQQDRPDAATGAAAGLALAAATLTKNTNLPLVLVAGVFLLVDLWRRSTAGGLREAVPALAWLCSCAVIPFGGWLARNQIVLGDLTGLAAQAALMSYVQKPISQWWPHPLFTPSGLGTFLRDVTVSFWRGEFVWQGRRIASAAADALYVLSTAFCLAAAAAQLAPRFRRTALEHRVLGFALATVLAAFGFLAFLSVSIDFSGSSIPPPEFPFINAGRYATGALIPFAVLYVSGLDHLLQWCRVRTEWARFAVLAAILIFTTASEIAASRPVFSSPYNWFALQRS